jgi:hypothetical protein
MTDPQLPEIDPQELADRLDDALSKGDSLSTLDPDPRVQFAQRLANAEHPAISDNAKTRIHQKMMLANRQRTASRRSVSFWPPLLLRWAAAFAIVLFSSALLFPSIADSVPGDALYPVKRGLESLELSASGSEAGQAFVYLRQAERRVDEIRALLSHRAFEHSLIVDAQHSLEQSRRIAQSSGSADPSLINGQNTVRKNLVSLLEDARQTAVLSASQAGTAIAIIVTPTASLVPSALPTQAVIIQPATKAPETPEVQSVSTEAVVPTHEPSASATAAVTATDKPSAKATGRVEPTASATSKPSVQTSIAPTIVTLTPSPTDNAPVMRLYINQVAKVRSGASIQSEMIAILQPGTLVEIIPGDSTNEWTHIRMPDGRIGWIAKFLLSAAPPTFAPIPVLPTTATNAEVQAVEGNEGNFNCVHPGNSCNAPGQTVQQPGNPPDTPPGQSNNPGQGNPPPGGGPPGGTPPGQGNKPTNPGKPNKP